MSIVSTRVVCDVCKEGVNVKHGETLPMAGFHPVMCDIPGVGGRVLGLFPTLTHVCEGCREALITSIRRVQKGRCRLREVEGGVNG